MPDDRIRIGFVSTRLAGTDGVSLEASKWARVLAELGHECFFFSGESDRSVERSRVVPEAHFSHPDVKAINKDLFNNTQVRSPATSAAVHALQAHLKAELRRFITDYDVRLLKVENALSLPMNVPLGLALTELIAETNIPTIAHHHDFGWERSRFNVNSAQDFLHAAFPPAMPNICHVVINSYAATELARRTGQRSTVIPNVMDFDNPPPQPGAVADELRRSLGLKTEDLFLLQPTRVVPRKCIERSIELTHRLGRPAALVVSHDSGDEGCDYEAYLSDYAKTVGVRVLFAADRFAHDEEGTPNGDGRFRLSDAYHSSHLVTYPSRVEGFGNAFLEAIYYRKPLVMSAYDIFRTDIQPKGFQVIGMKEFITPATIEAMQALLDDEASVEAITTQNYELARRHYSFSVLRDRLITLFRQYRARRSQGFQFEAADFESLDSP